MVDIRVGNSRVLPAPRFHWHHWAEATAPTRIVCLSGQGGVGEVSDQISQGYEHIDMLLRELNLTMRNVLKFNVFLTDADDIPVFTSVRESVYREYYPDDDYPPTTLVVVTRLRPPELRFEIDCIAAG